MHCGTTAMEVLVADIGGRAGGHWQSDKLRLVKSARGKCGRHGISVSRLQQKKVRYEKGVLSLLM